MKKYLLGLLTGAIVFTGIGVFATIAASSITYKGTTVDLALDDLYSKVNGGNSIDLENIIFDKSIGDVNSQRSITKTLEKGKYLLYVTYSVGQLQFASGTTDYSTEVITPTLFTLQFDSNTSTSQILGRYNGSHVSSGTVSSVHSNMAIEQLLYLVEIKEDNDVLTLTGDLKSNNYEANNLSLFAVKVQ